MILQKLIHSLLSLFGRKQLTIGLYGPPNGGKTTLANRICQDWLGETLGTVSSIAHETRNVQSRDAVTIKTKEGHKLSFTLFDTPGIASKIDYRDFVKKGLPEEEAKKRAREATRGVVEAIRTLSKVNVVIVVLDATKRPDTQVNKLLLENLKVRGTSIILVANKIDLGKAKPAKIEKAFGQPVIGISAKLGTNMESLYQAAYEQAK